MKKIFLSEKPILIITAERIGDILFCTPGIHLLKQNYPSTPIDVLVFSKTTAELFRFNPDIRQIITVNKRLPFGRWLKKYDLIINLTYEFKKYLNKSTGSFISIGEPCRQQHRAQQVLDFIQSLLPEENLSPPHQYQLYPQQAHHRMVKNLLQEQQVDFNSDLLIGCHLGCHRIARRSWQFWSRDRHLHKKVWPLENYIELSKQLYHMHPRLKLIITGSKNEMFISKFLNKKEMPWMVNLIGKTSLLETAALMDHLTAYITHDTGTLHIACSRNTSLIGLFGPTQVDFTGPFPLSENHIILEKPTISEISIGEVITALQHIMLQKETPECL